MLNVAAETIRFLCRGRPWSGLYVPVVHRSAINKLAQESGPYILGASQASCRMLTPPKDVMIVDLDRGRVTVQTPPMVFAKVSSREKFIGRLAAAVGPVQVSGVPSHLREAYAKNQLTPEGQVIAIRGRIEVIEAPKWWNQAAVLAEVCLQFRYANDRPIVFVSRSLKPKVFVRCCTGRRVKTSSKSPSKTSTSCNTTTDVRHVRSTKHGQITVASSQHSNQTLCV